MKHIPVATEIDLPGVEVWPFIAEFRHWPSWGPSIRRVETDAVRVATGVTGRVQTLVGVWLPFVITHCRPEELWHWRVAGVPATRHFIASAGKSHSRVEFSVTWPLAPYALVLELALRRLKTLAEKT